MSGLFFSVTARDLLLAGRRRIEALLPLGFFIVAAGLFPIGVGPEPQMLRQMAPGVVWVCALLAAMLSVTQMFASDDQDGSLEQMLLSSQPLITVVMGKVLAHWLSSGVPLVLAAPLIGILFDMRAASIGTLALTPAAGNAHPQLAGCLGCSADTRAAQRGGTGVPAGSAADHSRTDFRHGRRRRSRFGTVAASAPVGDGGTAHPHRPGSAAGHCSSLAHCNRLIFMT